MATYTLRRSGDAPLRIEGELLAESTSKSHSGHCQNRWHEAVVYGIDGDRYVLAVAYRTVWHGELDYHLAVVLGSPAEVARALRDYDPLAPVSGLPPGEQYAEKQLRLQQAVRAGYERMVSELLAAAGEQFAGTPQQEESALREQLDLRRYRQVLPDLLSEVSLSQAEASLVCEACNGSWVFAGADPQADDCLWWPAQVVDAIRLNQLHRKWEVDAESLLAKLRSLTPPQLVAVKDAIERFWDEPERQTGELLRELGLVRA